MRSMKMGGREEAVFAFFPFPSAHLGHDNQNLRDDSHKKDWAGNTCSNQSGPIEAMQF